MFRQSKRISGRIHNILGVCADKSFPKDPANNIVYTTQPAVTHFLRIRLSSIIYVRINLYTYTRASALKGIVVIRLQL